MEAYLAISPGCQYDLNHTGTEHGSPLSRLSRQLLNPARSPSSSPPRQTALNDWRAAMQSGTYHERGGAGRREQFRPVRRHHKRHG